MKQFVLGLLMLFAQFVDAQETYILDLSEEYIKPSKVRQYQKHKHLSTLKLIYNGLDSIPNFAFEYQFLLKLVIRDNPITKISSRISQLKSLRYLEISGSSLDSFPNKLRELVSLRKLYFFNNSFRLRKSFTLTDSLLFLPNLKELHIYQVNLDSIFVDLGTIPQLKSLKLSECNIRHIEKLSNSQTLTTLNLDNNKLYVLPEGITTLKKLKSLSLKNNYLTEIPEKIYQLKHLESLDLRGNFLNQYQKDLLGALLPFCNILTD